MTQLTVRLDAINEVLDLLGKSQVTTATESSGSTQVQSRLDSVTRELQDRSWWFNRDRDVQHTVTAFGWAHLFKDTYIPETRRIASAIRTVAGSGLWIAERDGRRIYNLSNKTFVWNSSPPNQVLDPFALGTANWTPTSLTVTSNVQNVDPPGFTGARNVELLAKTSDPADLTQTVLSTLLTDTQTYVVGGYFRNGAVGSTAARLEFKSAGGGDEAFIAWNPTTGARLSVEGQAIDGDVILMEEPGGWAFVYFEREWTSALGNMDLVIQPDTGAGTTNDVYATGLSVIVKGTSGPQFDVLRCYPFEDLPNVARTYVIRKTATEMNDKLGGTASRRRHLFGRELIALGQLQQADQAHGGGGQLWGSRTVSRVTGTLRRRPALDSLGHGRVLFNS